MLKCNAYNGSDLTSIDPQTDDIAPLFNPRLQAWNEHFQLERAFIRPLTTAGRVTVFLLRFNIPKRLKERQELTELERYPCEEDTKST